MKLKEIIANETRLLFGGRYPLALIIFGLPMFFSVVFGIAYSENVVNNVPLVVYDQEQSSLSRKMIQAYGDSERFNIVAYTDSQEQMEDLLNTGKALAGLGIPPDFTQKIESGDRSDVLFMANSTNNVFANAAVNAANEINRTFSVSVAQKLIEAAGVLPSQSMNMVYPVHLGVRILNNPVNGYSLFMTSGLMLNGLQISLLLTAAPLLADEYQRRRYKREYRSIDLLIGKTIPCWITAVLAYSLSLLILKDFLYMPLNGKFWQLLLLGGAFSFMVIQIMLFFSSISENAVLSMELPLLYIMPGLLFSGLSWPIFTMNKYAAFFSALLPLSYSADALRDLMLAGYAPSLLQDIFMMLAIGILAGTAALAIFSFKRKRIYTA